MLITSLLQIRYHGGSLHLGSCCRGPSNSQLLWPYYMHLFFRVEIKRLCNSAAMDRQTELLQYAKKQRKLGGPKPQHLLDSRTDTPANSLPLLTWASAKLLSSRLSC